MQPPFVLGDDVYLIASSDIEVLSLANGAVVADLPFVFHAERYTPDEQEDLSQLDFLVVAPPRGGG